jgi:hypothetical protein
LTAAEELGEESEESEEEIGEEDVEPKGVATEPTTGQGSAEEATRAGRTGPRYLVELMRSLGQMQANDSGWPTFDGRFVSYPRFKREWKAYRQTYHAAVGDDLAARTLRDKCLQGDARQMVGYLDDLREMWETLDTCYERPDKYAEEALKPIADFRRYKIIDSAAVREFYSLVRAAIKGARRIGRVELLVNDQTIPKIMSRMPPSDWKEWATKRPGWVGQDAVLAFEEFIERKWRDALNIAATEPAPWRGDEEKGVKGPRMSEKTGEDGQGLMKLTGAVNVVEQGGGSRPISPQWDLSFRRKCRARNLIGCDGDHVMLQCDKLLGLGLAERKDVLERSGLCTFCLKHSAEFECYGKGGLSKPRFTRSGCDGEHTPNVHRLMGEDSARVNLLAGDESEEEYEAVREGEGKHRAECEYKWEYEDGGLWVGTVGAVEMLEGGEESPCTADTPASDLGGCPNGIKSEDQANGNPGEEPAEARWWCLEMEYLSAKDEEAGAPQVEPHHHHPYGTSRPGHLTTARKQGTREKRGTTADQQWEEARRNARLRQMLSDSLGSEDESEDEEQPGRCAESERWRLELYEPP